MHTTASFSKHYHLHFILFLFEYMSLPNVHLFIAAFIPYQYNILAQKFQPQVQFTVPVQFTISFYITVLFVVYFMLCLFPFLSIHCSF